MQRVKDFLFASACTSLGFGYSPIVPGTIGTIPSFFLFLLIAFTVAPERQAPIIAAILVLACLLSLLLAPWAEKQWGLKDPRRFVLDEVAGYFFTILLFWPFVVYHRPRIVMIACAAFVATRFFDIIKPFPARRLEALPKGWGILLDDLAASLYAIVSLHIVLYFFPQIFLQGS